MKKKKTKKNKDIKLDQNTKLILNFVCACFLLCLIFIKGENLWYVFRFFILGIFGINSIFIPIFLIVYNFLKLKNGTINNLKCFLWCIFSVSVSSMIGIFSFPKINPISYYYNLGITNSGVLSGAINVILVKCFGVTASIAILIMMITFISFVLFKIDINRIFEKMKIFFLSCKNSIPKISIPKFNEKIKNVNNEECNNEVVVNSTSLNDLRENLNNDDNLEVKTKYEDNDDDVEKITEAFIEKEKIKSEYEDKLEKISFKNENTLNYKFPLIEFLNLPPKSSQGDITNELNTNGKLLIDTLLSFNVKAKIVDICRGPSITRYEIQPASGVKVSKITTLSDDIALNLAALGVRIEAPIPGKSAVGVEIPNRIVSTVTVREIIESKEFIDSKSSLTVSLGKDISGKPIVTDLGKMPHLLIAGSTGAGKSVCVNSFIISLLYKASPDDVKLLMIDPKVVELGVYNGVPHLLVPVVTEPRKSAGALNWAVNEMLSRYKIFAEVGVRDISSYNLLVEKRKNGCEENSKVLNKMARIVIIIDELSDLMMAAPNEIEDYVCRLTQMARAAGMHLVIATQRPSVDVITGVIKANVPSRIALAVSSQVDSRTILDMGGAEKLLGRGDMLFSPLGSIKPIRVQGCFVTDEEIEKVVEYIKNESTCEYDEKVILGIEKGASEGISSLDDENSEDNNKDPMLEEAIKCVIECGQASTSLLQRRLRLGYARAGRLIDEMEHMGIVGPHEGSKPRQVIISYQEFLERQNINSK